MGKLICADGTIVQINSETEKELRVAFGPKLEPKFGDIVEFKHGNRGSRRVILYDSQGELHVYSVSYKKKPYKQDSIRNYVFTGENIFTDNLLNLKF